MKRLLYLGYYILHLNWSLLNRFILYAAREHKKSKWYLIIDMVCASLRYNIALLEYFQFGFYNLKNDERAEWAGTGTMYEYQLIMNPKAKRHILDNKVLFYKNYREYIKHIVADLDELKKDSDLSRKLIENKGEKIVFKVFNGKCGQQVQIKKANEFNNGSLVQFMEQNNFDLAEEYIVQHPSLMALSPTAVNTIRIITQLNLKNEVDLLGCRLRISVNAEVDNMAAGNIAALVDESTGVVLEPAVYSDITKQQERAHPVTGVNIVGFQIPYWQETISMVKKAAKLHPENRSVGWDVAMTQNGPELIEGNHDWCKLVWQLPVKKGLKPLLDRYLKEFRAI